LGLVLVGRESIDGHSGFELCRATGDASSTTF
jgi:hypothetical protein